MKFEAELAVATAIAKEAGEIIRVNFSAGMSKDWKADGTPVTATDTAINTLVIQKLSAVFPADSILGEEESYNLGASRIWVCDPVDGTMPFSHGIPISTFSLALVIDGTPVLGIVLYPFMNQLYWAVKGAGAWMDKERLSVSSTGFTNALVEVVGFPSTRPVLDADGGIFTELFGKGAKITSLWSAILPTCLVARGQYTAVIFNVDQPQDGAAIKVIVEEAGGKVTDLFGNEQRYDREIQGFVASNGVVHDDIIRLLKSYPAVKKI